MEVKLSSKNQIVVPREARQALGIKSGDRILVVTRGETVILLPKPRRYSKAIEAIAKVPYPASYLKRERASWK